MNKKALVIKLSSIGDIVEISPAVRALVRAGYEVHHLCLPSMKNISAMIPGISGTIEMKEGLPGIVRTLLLIRKEKYGIVFNFHRDAKSHIFCSLTGAVSAGFKWGFFSFLLKIRTVFDSTIHDADRYLGVVKAAGAPPAGLYTEVKIPAKASNDIDIKNGKRAGLFPGGAKNAGTVMMTKRWPRENFIETGKLLVEKGYDVYVFGGEMDRAEVEAVCRGIGRAKEVITGLEDFVFYVSKMDVFIAPDTGPLHLAAAAGVKTIGLYGPTSPANFGARGKNSINIYEGAECSPCYEPATVHKREFLKCRDNICMKKITPLKILENL